MLADLLLLYYIGLLHIIYNIDAKKTWSGDSNKIIVLSYVLVMLAFIET
jgi:hypothetical protein